MLKLFGFSISNLSESQKLLLRAAVNVFVGLVQGRFDVKEKIDLSKAKELAAVVGSSDKLDEQLEKYKEWLKTQTRKD